MHKAVGLDTAKIPASKCHKLASFPLFGYHEFAIASKLINSKLDDFLAIMNLEYLQNSVMVNWMIINGYDDKEWINR